jgi:hypothetical protein
MAVARGIEHTSVVLARPHLSIAGARTGRPAHMSGPDPSLLDDVVNPRVIDAMKVASRALQGLGIRHVVVGGLAVGANGHPRATKSVDFLVGDEAFEHHPGGFVTMKPGVPIQVGGVAIDLLSVGEDEGHLAEALAAPPGSIIEAAPLIYLKLKSPRQKDLADVVELIKAGIDIAGTREYLARNAPGYVDAFDAAATRAASEE